MTDLSTEAAAIADTSLLVRARFIEAADTMAHLQVRNTRPADGTGYWPAVPTMVDGDYRSPYRTSAAAISRTEECLQRWLLELVHDQEQRVLIGRWSASLAVPKIVGSFRQFCRKSGRNRSTAERRLDQAFQCIASGLLKSSYLLREPDWSRVMPMLPDWGRDIDMVAERVAERQMAWHAPDAKPTDQPDMRDTSWAEDQNRRRRERAERGTNKAA